MPGAHARLAPSAAKLWMTCPGQPALAELVPDESSDYAREGTTAHEVARRCLIPHPATGTLAARNPDHLIGQVVEGVEVTQEMVDAVRVYLSYCVQNTTNGDIIRIEERLRLNDDVWGTGDFLRYRPSTGELLIVDYKHGAGIYVDVYENYQTLIYALMAAKLFQKITRVKIVIVQPRCGDEQVREWETDSLRILEWEADVNEAVARTRAANAPLVPGNHCKNHLCKVRATCPALKQMAQTRARETFKVNTNMALTDLAARLEEVAALQTYITAVEDLAYQLAMKGQAIPGHKLVWKRPQRQWLDEREALEVLESLGLDRDQVSKLTVKSPAEVEKLLPPKVRPVLKDYYSKVSSGLTLVHESDKRPEHFPDQAVEVFGRVQIEHMEDDILS